MRDCYGCVQKPMRDCYYIQFQNKYGGKFIAKSDDQVVTSASTYKSLISAIIRKRLQRNKLIFTYIHPKGAICVYRVSSESYSRSY